MTAARARPARTVDLSAEMRCLVERLGAPGPDGGRAVQFVSARSGEGASTVARAFAEAAAADGLRTWLVELDVLAGVQAQALAASPHGPLGPSVRASPDGSLFFDVTPASSLELLEAHRLREAPLWVTRFRREALPAGAKVRITGSGAYWAALRANADLVVVDAPAAERSRAAAAVAPHMDATVIVVAADGDDRTGPSLLRDGIVAVGGRCAGAVLNRAPRTPPAFLRRLAS